MDRAYRYLRARCQYRRKPCLKSPRLASPCMSTELVVIATHIRVQTHCDSLARTLGTVQCYHPDAIILIVDNGSPHNNVEGTLSAMRRWRPFRPRHGHCEPLANGTAQAERVHILSVQGSRGQFGAWHLANEWLHERSGRRGDVSLDQIETVVLLQHSTRLVKRVRALPRGCQAACLSTSSAPPPTFIEATGRWHGWITPSKPGTSWMCSVLAENTRLIEQTPYSHGEFACVAPCHDCSLLLNATDWRRTYTTCDHAAMAISQHGWRALESLHARGTYGRVGLNGSGLTQAILGIEIYAGALAAWLNHRAQSESAPCQHQLHSVLKTHTGTHMGSGGRLSERCFPGASAEPPTLW